MSAILIVDENMLVREGLKHLLHQAHRGLTFGEAATGDEVHLRLAKRSWDVAVVDVSGTGHDGFHTVREIRRTSPSTRVLVLSSHFDSEHFARARQYRAAGCCYKNCTRSELIKTFQDILAGREHFASPPPEAPNGVTQHPPLSTRERDVLARCVAGKRMSEIASELNLSIKTVSTYKRRILDKVQLSSVSELVRHAVEHKL